MEVSERNENKNWAACPLCHKKIYGVIDFDYLFVALGSGHIYRVSSMLHHLYDQHRYLPPVEFMEDISHQTIGYLPEAEDESKVVEVGNVSGAFPFNVFPGKVFAQFPQFKERLEGYIDMAKKYYRLV